MKRRDFLKGAVVAGVLAPAVAKAAASEVDITVRERDNNAAQTFSEWLRKQPEETQRAVLGDSYLQWTEGTMLRHGAQKLETKQLRRIVKELKPT